MRKLFLILSLLGLSSQVKATTWTLIHAGTFTTTSPCSSAGCTLQDGWVDISGNQWGVNGSSFTYYPSGNPANPWINGRLCRPNTEAYTDMLVISTFTFSTVANQWFTLKDNHGSSTPNAYLAGPDNNGHTFDFYAMSAGGLINLQQVNFASTLTNGTNYQFQASVVQTNSTTTTIYAEVDTSAGVLIASTTVTDTTAVLQNTYGTACMFMNNAANTIQFANSFSDYHDALTYTIALPETTSQYVNLASKLFTITLSNFVPFAVNIVPTDNGGQGLFYNAGMNFPALSTGTFTFEYVGTTAGAKTISATNNGGLTNPVGVTFTVNSGNAIPVSNGAFAFSPGNWVGNSNQRGPSGATVGNIARTWNTGAYFRFTWNASASPTLSLIWNSSSTSSANVSYLLNGNTTNIVSGVGSTSITVSTPSASNTLEVYFSSKSFTALNWNLGTDQLIIAGALLDAGSTAGTASYNTKWVQLVGDSITDGSEANNGAFNAIYDYSFYLGQGLRKQGYEYSVSAAGNNGWLQQGGGLSDIPDYYYTSGGTYTDSLSRWNKVDLGVSLLDSNGQMSAYGGLGSTPSAIFLHMGTNDARVGSNTTDTQNSVQQYLTAARAAAPQAIIIVYIPPYLYSNGKSSWLTAVKNGISSYQTANPGDNRVIMMDSGATFQNTISNNPFTGDGLHPNIQGNGLMTGVIGPFVQNQITSLSGSSGFGGGGGFSNYFPQICPKH